MTACIVGWSHGKFGKLDGETSESLIVKAASEAIAHAGIEPKDVDVIYVGNMNGGFVRQEFHSSLALQMHPDLARRVSEVDVSDVRDAVLILKGDTALVRVGAEQFAERLQSYLDLAPALRERISAIDYVDLRFDERVYVRPAARTQGRPGPVGPGR